MNREKLRQMVRTSLLEDPDLRYRVEELVGKYIVRATEYEERQREAHEAKARETRIAELKTVLDSLGDGPARRNVEAVLVETVMGEGKAERGEE